MDKKKVKEHIQRALVWIDPMTTESANYETAIKMAAKNLEFAMEELSKSDWVSVEDGLPDLDELVVACNKNRPDNWWETFRDSQMADEWEDENGFPIEEKVTHWKPIEKLEE